MQDQLTLLMDVGNGDALTSDSDCSPPAVFLLNRGWNKVLIRVSATGASWSWDLLL